MPPMKATTFTLRLPTNNLQHFPVKRVLKNALPPLGRNDGYYQQHSII